MGWEDIRDTLDAEMVNAIGDPYATSGDYRDAMKAGMLTAHAKTLDDLLAGAGGPRTHVAVGALQVGEADEGVVVLSACYIDPSEWGGGSIKLRAVAHCESAFTDSQIQLYNIADAEYVDSSLIEFSGTTPTMFEVTITVGAGAGQLRPDGAVYEVRALYGPAGRSYIGAVWLVVGA